MSVIRGIAPPNLPIAPRNYDRRYQDQFGNVLKLFFTSITSEVNAPVGHASYYDTTTQTNPVADEVNLFTYNSTTSEFQVQTGVPTSKIYVSSTGLYNIQFSAQLDKTGGAATAVYIWPRINGQNVTNSATKVVIDGPNSEIVPAWNFLLPLKTGDYFELAWQSNDTDVIILAEPASGNIPSIPSIILTVVYVSRLEQ
tara:strand:- start:470 stop:1063 length:594 start_codon:yes stop_codon:yes gene_type:complete